MREREDARARGGLRAPGVGFGEDRHPLVPWHRASVDRPLHRNGVSGGSAHALHLDRAGWWWRRWWWRRWRWRGRRVTVVLRPRQHLEAIDIIPRPIRDHAGLAHRRAVAVLVRGPVAEAVPAARVVLDSGGAVLQALSLVRDERAVSLVQALWRCAICARTDAVAAERTALHRDSIRRQRTCLHSLRLARHVGERGGGAQAGAHEEEGEGSHHCWSHEAPDVNLGLLSLLLVERGGESGS